MIGQARVVTSQLQGSDQLRHTIYNHNGLNLFGLQQDKLSSIRGFETEDHDVAVAARSPRRVLMHFIGLGVSVFKESLGSLDGAVVRALARFLARSQSFLRVFRFSSF